MYWHNTHAQAHILTCGIVTRSVYRYAPMGGRKTPKINNLDSSVYTGGREGIRPQRLTLNVAFVCMNTTWHGISVNICRRGEEMELGACSAQRRTS